MKWLNLEKAFNRAILLSFSRKKFIMAFPILVLCGIFFICCKEVSFATSGWLSISFAFLPILLSSTILFILGLLLVRIHYYEARGMPCDFKKLLSSSLNLIVRTAYLSILPIVAYLFLSIFLGFFFLMRAIPWIGNFISVFFSFGPFLLIFSVILLCLFNLWLLFFITPGVAFHSWEKRAFAKQLKGLWTEKLFSSSIFFLIALIPTVVVGALLYLAACLTNVNFLVGVHSLSVALEWFFIAVPFCAILAPAVIFFFNFGAESHQLLQGAMNLETPSSFEKQNDPSDCNL